MIRFSLIFAAWAGGVVAEPLFEDRSAALPNHVYDGGWTHFVGGGVAVFDCNGDDLPDVFAAGGANPAKLIRNDSGFTFTQMPLTRLDGVTGAYPLDINGDRVMDLFVLRVGANVILQGGPDCTFTDATAALGLPSGDKWSTAFTAWWAQDDTRPTFAVGNYVDQTDPDGPFEACDSNAIYAPHGDVYAETVLEPGFCPLSILAARDARDRLTLRLSNDRHYYVKGGYEQMWDIDEARFLGPEDGWNTVSLWGMGIASRDLNADGRDEVMLTSMGDQLLQLAQEDGTYAAAPYDIGTYAQRPHVGDDGRPSTGWHAEFGDVDNDGRPDLFIAKGNGAAWADFDQDGRLDLIVTNRRAPLEIYRNVTEGVGQWLRVDLAQEGGNTHAIGAVVVVNGQSQQKTVGGGHAGGQSLPLHFGLGAADQAKVTVTWPDGATTHVRHDQAAWHICGYPQASGFRNRIGERF